MSSEILKNLDDEYPDLARLRDAADEVESRRATSRQLEVLDYNERASNNEDVVSPGTMNLILARPESRTFRALYEGVKGRQTIEKGITDEIRKAYSKRKTIPLSDAVLLMKKQSVIADLVGGRYTLASNLFVPDDIDVVIVPMPYNGGSIKGIKFTLIERVASEAAIRLDAFIIRRPPSLTKAEKAALRLVPRDELTLNVGRAAMCYAITMVAVVAVVMGATYACPGEPFDPHLTEDDLKQLGPELSARKLLQLRRQALERRV